MWGSNAYKVSNKVDPTVAMVKVELLFVSISGRANRTKVKGAWLRYDNEMSI